MTSPLRPRAPAEAPAAPLKSRTGRECCVLTALRSLAVALLIEASSQYPTSCMADTFLVTGTRNYQAVDYRKTSDFDFRIIDAAEMPLQFLTRSAEAWLDAVGRISDVHNAAKPRKVLPEFAVAQVQSARSLAAAERHVARIEAGRAPKPRKVLLEFAVAQAQSARSLAAAERHVARIEAGRAPKPRKLLPEFPVAQAQSARSLAAAERHVARIEAGRAPKPRKLLPEFALAQAQSARSLAAAERHVARIEVARQLAQ